MRACNDAANLEMGLANDAANLEMGQTNEAAPLLTASVRSDQRKCLLLRSQQARSVVSGGVVWKPNRCTMLATC
jgi:hypothetical protein